MAMDRRGARGERGAGNQRREVRARAAARHIEEMEARFAREIAASVAGVRRYDGMPETAKAPAPEPEAEPVETAPVEGAAGSEDAAVDAAPESVESAPAAEPEAADLGGAEPEVTPGDAEPDAAEAPAPELPRVEVLAGDATEAIIANGRGRAQFCDLAVLDFASFTGVAGGYDRGSWAQEQALCADSFLYNVLATQKDWYAENRRRNLNCELYRNRALAVPAVRFTRGKVHAYADVIVAAAPNARRAREEYGVGEERLRDALRDRVRFALAVADDLGHDKLVLGAFGCGSFGWDAEVVAEAFRAELARGTHRARHVVFAVPEARYNDHLPKFAHVLGAFPEAPSEPYAAAAARAAEASAAERAGDDEDDDDWRKYL